jgi:hypothetical protein
MSQPLERKIIYAQFQLHGVNNFENVLMISNGPISRALSSSDNIFRKIPRVKLRMKKN